MWNRENPAELISEYFFRQLCALEEKQTELVLAIRTKKGLLILCDKLRELEVEKRILIKVYEDLKPFFR